MDSAAEFYALHVSSTFSGDAGDVMDGHNGMKFSANIRLPSVDDDDDDDDDAMMFSAKELIANIHRVCSFVNNGMNE